MVHLIMTIPIVQVMATQPVLKLNIIDDLFCAEKGKVSNFKVMFD